MRHFRFAALPLLLALAMAAAGCGIDKETAAVEVAEQWTEDNINDVSEVLVNLVMEAPVVADTFDKMPSLVADRASDMLAYAFSQRIREYLVVNYTSSTRVADDIYRVAGTARLSVQVDLPVVETRSFAASLPFTLDVNLAERTADLWTPLFELANIWEIMDDSASLPSLPNPFPPRTEQQSQTSMTATVSGGNSSDYFPSRFAGRIQTAHAMVSVFVRDLGQQHYLVDSLKGGEYIGFLHPLRASAAGRKAALWQP